MSVTQKPLPGADSKHFLAISYPLDWEKTQNSITRRILLLPDLEFLLPAFALDELAKHRAKIVRAARLKGDELDLLLTLLLTAVAVIPFERIAPYLPEADALIGAIDPDDIPFVVVALAEEHD